MSIWIALLSSHLCLSIYRLDLHDKYVKYVSSLWYIYRALIQMPHQFSIPAVSISNLSSRAWFTKDVLSTTSCVILCLNLYTYKYIYIYTEFCIYQISACINAIVSSCYLLVSTFMYHLSLMLFYFIPAGHKLALIMVMDICCYNHALFENHERTLL